MPQQKSDHPNPLTGRRPTAQEIEDLYIERVKLEDGRQRVRIHAEPIREIVRGVARDRAAGPPRDFFENQAREALDMPLGGEAPKGSMRVYEIERRGVRYQVREDGEFRIRTAGARLFLKPAWISDSDSPSGNRIRTSVSRSVNVRSGALQIGELWPGMAARYQPRAQTLKGDFYMSPRALRGLSASAAWFLFSWQYLAAGAGAVDLVRWRDDVWLVRGDTALARLPVPVAKDSAGQAVTGRWWLLDDYLVGGLPMTWLRDRARQWPIVIDPSASSGGGTEYGVIRETVHERSGNTFYCRAFVMFPMPSLSWASIDAATLNVYCDEANDDIDPDPSASVRDNFEQDDQDWTTGDFSSMNAITLNAELAASQEVTAVGWWSWNVLGDGSTKGVDALYAVELGQDTAGSYTVCLYHDGFGASGAESDVIIGQTRDENDDDGTKEFDLPGGGNEPYIEITYTAPETVSDPNAPSGDTTADQYETKEYTASGSVSSYGHSLQYIMRYRVEGGAFSYTNWIDDPKEIEFSSGGTYNIQARARCATDTSVVSSWATVLEVEVTPEGVAEPSPVSGPSVGFAQNEYTFTLGVSTVTSGDDVEYRLAAWDPVAESWDYTGWQSSNVFDYTFGGNGGTWLMRAQARCATHTSNESGWTTTHGVTITAEAFVGSPVITGPITGATSGTGAYGASGVTLNSGRAVSFRMDYRNATTAGAWQTGTIGVNPATITYDQGAGTYEVRAVAFDPEGDDNDAGGGVVYEVTVTGEANIAPDIAEGPETGVVSLKSEYTSAGGWNNLGHEIERQARVYLPNVPTWATYSGYSPHDALASELLTNGELEGTYASGVAPDWVKGGTGGFTPHEENSIPHGGAAAQGLTVETGNYTRYFRQDVALTTDVRYRLEFWMKQPKGKNMIALEITDGVTTQQIATYIWGYGDWRLHRFEFTPPSTKTWTLRFSWSFNNTSAFTVFLDDITLKTSPSFLMTYQDGAGTYQLQSRTRCQTDTGVVSAWSPSLNVEVERDWLDVWPVVSGPTELVENADANHILSVYPTLLSGRPLRVDFSILGPTGWAYDTALHGYPGRTWTPNQGPGTYALYVRMWYESGATLTVLADPFWYSAGMPRVVCNVVAEACETPWIFGDAFALDTQTKNYTVLGGAANSGHTVHYQTRLWEPNTGAWTESAWEPTANFSWLIEDGSGTYIVQGRTRCASHTSVVSDWSEDFLVQVDQEGVSTPEDLAGSTDVTPNSAHTYTWSTAVSSEAHAVEHVIEWMGADGLGPHLESWFSGTSYEITWPDVAGPGWVRVKARCASHPGIEGNWSDYLVVNARAGRGGHGLGGLL